MANKKYHKYLLQRDGASRANRQNPALDPASVKIVDLGPDDWFAFASDFAALLNFYGPESDVEPSGDWQDFFPAKNDIDFFLKFAGQSRAMEPHRALFLAFLKLLERSKAHLNTLPREHIDFYYKRVLQLSNQTFQPDQVHVLFELAKNVLAERIPGGTALKAGSDAKGQERTYVTDREMTLNHGKVSALRTIWNDPVKRVVRYAAAANSADGLGGALSEPGRGWRAFGRDEWPLASVGFALASSALKLREGTRTITFTFTFEKAFDKSLQPAFNLELSGAGKWLGPFTQTAKLEKKTKSFSLQYTLPADEEAVVAFDPRQLPEGFPSGLPIARFLLNGLAKEQYDFFELISRNKLKKITVGVHVIGLKNLRLENDLGPLIAAKPFMPFGSIPKVGSGFYVGHEEVAGKNCSDITLKVAWPDLPDLRLHYAAYLQSFQQSLTRYYYDLTQKDEDQLTEKVPISDANARAMTMKTLNTVTPGAAHENSLNMLDLAKDHMSAFVLNFAHIVTSNDYFTVSVGLRTDEGWVDEQSFKKLFNSGEADDEAEEVTTEKEKLVSAFSLTSSLPIANNLSSDQPFLRLKLEKDFLHSMYPRLYAVAMASKKENAIVPNEPYTPVMESVTLDYHASDSWDGNGGEATLYQLHPFGLQLAADHLLPKIPNGSQFLVGLENMELLNHINLLFQVAEGTENPLAPTFTNGRVIDWSVLTQTGWRELTEVEILANHTDNFLRSGIFQCQLPVDAASDNPWMGSGRYWLRALLLHPLRPDSAANMLGVHAQAVPSTFRNRDNELGHLQTALPAGTIGALERPLATVEKVLQPYSSSGGRPREADLDFYTRVSERLRHKNRAVTVWDYEHLVLQAFPSIYQVKCLIHTAIGEKGEVMERAPGHITLVVLPDIRKRNVFDPFCPRLAQVVLNEIQAFLKSRMGLPVHCQVINPRYESVQVNCSVVFARGRDATLYRDVLKRDLDAYLAPWTDDKVFNLKLNGVVHRSDLIHFIEKRPYVDYLLGFSIDHLDESLGVIDQNCNKITASSPVHVLGSSRRHSINKDRNDT